MEEKRVYYHYTTPESARSILKSGVINKSTKKTAGVDDVRHGAGVYLTQIEPTNPKRLIVYNNYDGDLSSGFIDYVVGKGEYCCVDVNGMFYRKQNAKT